MYSQRCLVWSVAQPVRRASDVPQRVGRAESACRRRAAARHAFGWRSPLRRVRGTHKPIRSSGLKLPCIAATLNLNSGGGLLAQRPIGVRQGRRGAGGQGMRIPACRWAGSAIWCYGVGKVLWAGRRDRRSCDCTGLHAARRSHASASSRLVRCTNAAMSVWSALWPIRLSVLRTPEYP